MFLVPYYCQTGRIYGDISPVRPYFRGAAKTAGREPAYGVKAVHPVPPPAVTVRAKPTMTVARPGTEQAT